MHKIVNLRLVYFLLSWWHIYIKQLSAINVGRFCTIIKLKNKIRTSCCMTVFWYFIPIHPILTCMIILTKNRIPRGIIFLKHQRRKPNDWQYWCSKRVLTSPIVFVIFGPKWVLYVRLVLHKVIGSQVKSCFVIYFQILSWRVRKRIIGS